MWDLPRPGIEPAPPTLAGRFLTTGPPGKFQDSEFESLKPLYDSYLPLGGPLTEDLTFDFFDRCFFFFPQERSNSQMFC